MQSKPVAAEASAAEVNAAAAAKEKSVDGRGCLTPSKPVAVVAVRRHHHRRRRLWFTEQPDARTAAWTFV